MFRQRILPPRILERNYVISAIDNFKPEAVAKKIRESMSRLNIREESFYVKLLVDQTDSDITNPDQIMRRLQNPEE